MGARSTTNFPSLSVPLAPKNLRTADTIHQRLEYVATYPNNGITNRSRNMVLAVHYDASYLNETRSCSRAGSPIFLYEDEPMPSHNVPILTILNIIKFIMSSANKDKLAAIFITTKKMVSLRQTLIGIIWLQPSYPLQNDNSTAADITNNKIVRCQTKSTDMRLYWLRCRVIQYQLRFYLPLRGLNWGDYITKHNPTL